MKTNQLELTTSDGHPMPVATHLDEHSVAEGNLLEYPLFRLSQRPGKPSATEGATDRERFVHVYKLPDVADGLHTLERRVEITANQRWGFPTVLGLRVLVAVMERAQQMGFNSPRIPVTRAELCELLGIVPAGRTYKLLDHQLKAMQALSVIFHHCWYSKGQTRPHQGVKTQRLIADFCFDQEGGAKPDSQTAFNFQQSVTLGDGLFESLKAGYRVGLDRGYINEIAAKDHAAAVRLYTYLSKKDRRERYVENLVNLAGKLPLIDLRPSKLRKTLEPALQLLATPRPGSGKRFLEKFSFDGTGTATRLVVTYYSPDGAPKRLRALANT